MVSADSSRAAAHSPTFADFPSRRNSLNFVRLLLAVSVIVSHAWPIGRFGPDPELGQFSPGSFAVAGFFALSGWLITQSRLTKGLSTYTWHRFLRIYPGFLVALLVTAFVFAPIGALVSTGHYRLVDGVDYVVQNSALNQTRPSIDGTLPGWAYPAWNGSLWTLIHEVGCYVLVGLLVTVLGRRHIASWSILGLITLTAAAVFEPHYHGHVPGLLRIFVQFAPFFFAGSVVYAVRERIVMRWQYSLLAAIITVSIAYADLPPTLAALPIAYGLLWAGAALPEVFRRVGRRNDISYGVYIYAFPVQQLLALFGAARFGVAAYIGLCVVATLPVAALSWFAVERPSLKWRHAFDPGRRGVQRATEDGPPDRVFPKRFAVRKGSTAFTSKQ